MSDYEKQTLELTAENVNRIYKDCSLIKEELKNGEPICDCSFSGGFLFHSGRLQQHDEEIANMLDQLPGIDGATSLIELSTSKYWSLESCMQAVSIVEILVALGIASGNLEYCFHEEIWPSLPGGKPLFKKSLKEKMKTL